MTTTTLTSKPHYEILDGLRGVAALMVVAFHIFEAHTPNRFEQIINHGYLAVDFFFVLSGFVVSYAYDDRWGKMNFSSFLKRRVTRLQPMVIMGMIVGAALFYFQDSVMWPTIHEVPVWKVIVYMLIGFTMIPLPTSMDIRGWHEMYPLDGPGWTLFFEYIANILYGLFIRRFSNTALAILVFAGGCALVHLTTTGTNGDVIGGWSLDPDQLLIGFTRLTYPFFAGLLLHRLGKVLHIKNAFTWCSLLIIAVLVIPRIGDAEHLWMNGLYDSFSIIVIFPLVVLMGAGGVVKGKFATRLCKFFGDISYPIYITHYPIIYVYTAWVYDKKVPLKDAFPMSVLAFLSCITLAWVCLKFYDEPVRRWLNKKVLQKTS